MTDKCVCIKSYKYETGSNIIFEEGKVYEYTDQKFISRDYPDGFNVCFTRNEYIYFRKQQDPLAEQGYGLFSTYFKTLSEIRKDKILKIKERKCSKKGIYLPV